MLPRYLAYGAMEYAKLRVSGLGRKIGCSMAPTIQCNLECRHCYEAGNRRTRQKELTPEEFGSLAQRLASEGMKHCTLTDGEPLISRASLEKCEAAVNTFWMTYIVTNGTMEFPDFPVFYVMSLDGPGKVHDSIRGEGVFARVGRNMKKAPTDRIWGLCTLNTLNHGHISETVEAAEDLGLRGIMFNWHTPKRVDDDLWLDYEVRENNIDEISTLKEIYPEFIYNEIHVLETMRNSDWTSSCPSNLVPSYDAFGNLKEPCIFGKGTDCEKCGCHVYPALRASIMGGRGTGQFRMAVDYADEFWVRDNLLSDIYSGILAP